MDRTGFRHRHSNHSCGAPSRWFWRKAVSPYAEEAAKIFWQGRPKRSPLTCLPTRLTQARRSRAKAGNLVVNAAAIPKTKPRCPICGASGHNRLTVLRESAFQLGESGQSSPTRRNWDASPLTARLPKLAGQPLQAKQAQALRKWNPSDLPGWLDEDAYRRDILPLLSKFTVKSIRLTLGVSHPYATLIRRGMTIPHPRHWLPLADLAGYRK